MRMRKKVQVQKVQKILRMKMMMMTTMMKKKRKKKKRIIISFINPILVCVCFNFQHVSLEINTNMDDIINSSDEDALAQTPLFSSKI